MKKITFSLCVVLSLHELNLSVAQETTGTQGQTPSFVSQVATIAGRRVPKAEEVAFTVRQLLHGMTQLQAEATQLRLLKNSVDMIENVRATLADVLPRIQAADADMAAFFRKSLRGVNHKLDILERVLEDDRNADGGTALLLRLDLIQAQLDLNSWFSAINLPEKQLVCGQTQLGTYLPAWMEGYEPRWIGNPATGFATLDQCTQATQAMQGDLVCVPGETPQAPGYLPFSIARSQGIGSSMGYQTLQQCNRAITEVYFGRICAVTHFGTKDPQTRYTWQFDLRTLNSVSPATDAQGAFFDGSDHEHFACRRALRVSRATHACIPNLNSSGSWTGAALYRFTDQKIIRTFTSAAGATLTADQVQNMEDCTAAILALEQ